MRGLALAMAALVLATQRRRAATVAAVLGDTIYATASPAGSAARAVLRLSGPSARAAAAAVFAPALPERRCQQEGTVAVCGGRIPAYALGMPGPRSYTGEDVVELHVPGSPLLVGELQRAMVAAVGPALRAARPGEFTARACLHGRLDFLQAEGVLMLIHGADAHAAAAGVAWLTGGLSAMVGRIRARLQDALALLELGLDFEAGETGAVDDAQWLTPVQAAHADLQALLQTLPQGAPGGEVLLLGRSNAGKSSLCNALAGRDAVLVDAGPGTTRDLLRVPIGDGAAVWDAPGDLDEPSDLDRAALQLRDRLGGQAAAALLVVDPAAAPPAVATPLPLLAVVFAKADAVGADRAAAMRARLGLPAGLPEFVVSARTGRGIAELRAFLVASSRAGARDVGAPLRAALGVATAAVERVLAGAVGELAGVDLQEALAALSAIDGSHGVEDLLDRIYARFCLGK